MKSWFVGFDYEHDIAHKDLDNIVQICDQLTAALTTFSDPGYGSDQSTKDIECQISQFFGQFYEMRLSAVESITHLRYEVDVLLNMVDEYGCDNNLLCAAEPEGAATCESRTNKEKCDLLAFLDGVRQYGAEAKKQLDALLQSCDLLGGLARAYDCKYGPSCTASGCGCGSGSEVSSADIVAAFSNDFLGQFVAGHDVAHAQLQVVSDICDALTAQIAIWLARY